MKKKRKKNSSTCLDVCYYRPLSLVCMRTCRDFHVGWGAALHQALHAATRGSALGCGLLEFFCLSSIEKSLFCFSGFTVDASNFFIFLLTLTLTSITATSQAYAVSSRLSMVAAANLLLALSFILFVVWDFNTQDLSLENWVCMTLFNIITLVFLGLVQWYILFPRPSLVS